MTDKPEDRESYVLGAAMASRFLAAYNAKDPGCADMLQSMFADTRGAQLAFRALCEVVLNALKKLEDNNALEGSLQCWLDRLAMSIGAEADDVVARYRGKAEQ